MHFSIRALGPQAACNMPAAGVEMNEWINEWMSEWMWDLSQLYT